MIQFLERVADELRQFTLSVRLKRFFALADRASDAALTAALNFDGSPDAQEELARTALALAEVCGSALNPFAGLSKALAAAAPAEDDGANAVAYPAPGTPERSRLDYLQSAIRYGRTAVADRPPPLADLIEHAQAVRRDVPAGPASSASGT